RRGGGSSCACRGFRRGTTRAASLDMLHLIPSRQRRSSDDSIFALHAEARARKGRGEPIVDATVGVLLDEEGGLAILPTAARAVNEVPPEEWAAYAPIVGTDAFLSAVKDDVFRHSPELRSCAVAIVTPGGSGALRHAIANYLEPGQSMLTTNFYWGPYET